MPQSWQRRVGRSALTELAQTELAQTELALTELALNEPVLAQLAPTAMVAERATLVRILAKHFAPVRGGAAAWWRAGACRWRWQQSSCSL